MSCIMLEPIVHAALAETLANILSFGFNNFGFTAPDSLKESLKECRDGNWYIPEKIYERLYSLNVAAYNDRYAGTWVDTIENTIPKMPEVFSMEKPMEYENHHQKILPWHFKFCKLLDSFLYQTCEDATRNDDLRIALISFSNTYKSFIIGNLDEYVNAPWDNL